MSENLINLLEKNGFKYDTVVKTAELNEPEIKKQKTAYFLGHNGLGDNITSISAVNFLLKYYETIHFLCRKHNVDNVKLIYNNEKVIIETVDVKWHCPKEAEGFKKIIDEADPDADCFILGFQNIKNFKNKITHPELLKYVPNNDGYNIRWSFIKDFYNDIGLDLSIYYNYFNIDSCETSKKLYENILNSLSKGDNLEECQYIERLWAHLFT
jgi:hypothetical protein